MLAKQSGIKHRSARNVIACDEAHENVRNPAIAFADLFDFFAEGSQSFPTTAVLRVSREILPSSPVRIPLYDDDLSAKAPR